jgi:hypothetical protein
VKRPNQALEQTRDSVLRYGEVVGCELLNFFVRPREDQSRSQEVPSRVGVSPNGRERFAIASRGIVWWLRASCST